MTPGEMADRLEIHEDYHPEEWWSSTFNEEGNCIVCAAVTMLREAERLLLSAEPTYRTEHIRAEWAMARGAWLEGTP